MKGEVFGDRMRVVVSERIDFLAIGKFAGIQLKMCNILSRW